MASYQTDSQHAAAHFVVGHMMISNVRDGFSGVRGSVEFDPSNLSSSHVEVTIDTATVSTREAERDRHLKSQDFLHVTRYPTITFRSTSIVATGSGSYQVAGDLNDPRRHMSHCTQDGIGYTGNP
jgi:polyisoprenoid-binding protein YceI